MPESKPTQGLAEMEKMLREGAWGCLAVRDGEGVYAVPLNYGYADGRIIFHCALEGKKLDRIRRDPRVCFTVARQPGFVREHPGGKPCEVDSDSVICRGTARILEDPDERLDALNAFNRAFRPDADDLRADQVTRCAAVIIDIDEMTARYERDGDVITYRWTAR